jgi:prophage maintenance system killer protein
MIFMATGNSVTFQQAGALLFAFATFHSFTDGNKRTALVTTQLFLNLNGYRFSYPKDTEDIVKSIASGRIRSNRTISKWLKDNSKKSRTYGYGGRTVILPDLGVEQVLTHLGVPIRVKRIE